MERVLLKNIDSETLPTSRKGKGFYSYTALEKIKKLEPQAVINEIKKSGLVGRSSAFPVAAKWETVRQEQAEPKYLVCNADEGEPGAFKDKLIMEQDPHLLLEAIIIAAYAVGAHQGYIYIRGEYYSGIESIERAIREAQNCGYLGHNILGTGFDFEIHVYKGAGAYICGEETSLLNSMAGLRPFPSCRPPFPAQSGFLGKPTVVNNVETLANIPAIIEQGGEWYSHIGNPEVPGTKLYCLSGQVHHPGVYELPLTIKLGELIDQYGGGVRGEFKAALPGGVSSGLVFDLNIRLDYRSVARAGSTLGPGSIIVINQNTSLIDISKNILQFFSKESCGKCSICREGIRNSLHILDKFSDGRAQPEDVKVLFELNQVMRDTAGCALGQSALNSTISAANLFPGEFQARMRNIIHDYAVN